MGMDCLSSDTAVNFGTRVLGSQTKRMGKGVRYLKLRAQLRGIPDRLEGVAIRKRPWQLRQRLL